MKTGAVITAAGVPRPAHDFKPLVKIGNTTIISRMVSNLRAAGITDIVAVTGYRAEELEKELSARGVTFLKNEDYATTDMFASARIGLRYLMSRVDRIVFSPGGVPFFHDNTLRAEMACDAPCVIPRFKGRNGHPILLASSLIPSVLEYGGSEGLRGALRSLPIKPLYVDVDDEGTVINVDRPDDFKKIADLRPKPGVRPAVKLQLVGEEPFMGPGPVTLLLQIDRLGSVREACTRTGISYSKGWKMIQRAEKALGCTLVERQQGGRNGGAAVLTEACRDIICRYEAFNEAVMEHVRREYEEIFGDYPFA